MNPTNILARATLDFARRLADVAAIENAGEADTEVSATAYLMAKASVVDALEAQLNQTSANARQALIAGALAAFEQQYARARVKPRYSGNVIDLAAYRAQRAERQEQAA